MKRVILALLLASSISIAHADSFADATAAYERSNYSEAVRLFQQSAEQGDASAQYIIGFMYYKGQGVPQDYAEAARWRAARAAVKLTMRD